MPDHPLIHLLDAEVPPAVATYWQAVGRLMTNFAEVESTLQIALWRMAETPTEIARAVFSGARVDTATSYIKRILEAQNADKVLIDHFSYVFAQLAIITKIRNDLVHYGPEWKDGQKSASVSNRLTAHIPSRRSETHLTPRDLDLMSLDLQKIRMHLFCMALVPLEPSPWQMEVLNAPWLYKSPARAGNQGKSRKDPQKQKPPRRSSRGSPRSQK